MSILVVCPGCRKRYQVNDKFAGKTGPCPNCKYLIKIPTKAEEVIIHTPENFGTGGRNADSQLVLKPITREVIKFDPLLATAIACTAGTIMAGAWMGGKIELFKNNLLITSTALTLISPLLAWAAYSILYDDEFEPYKGKSLLIRAAICGLIYAILWGVFAYVSNSTLTGELWNWIIIVPPFFAAGAMVAVTMFDLEFGNGFFHYSFYLLTTIFLRWIAGLGWIWNINQ